MDWRGKGSSDEKKWGDLGERRSRGVEVSPNDCKSVTEDWKCGSVEERGRTDGFLGKWTQMGEGQGGIDAETSAGGWSEGSPKVVRGCKADSQEEKCSLAAPGPGFEATLP